MNKELTVLQDNEVDLMELFKLFWQKKWFIVGTTLFFSLLGIVGTYFIKPVYQARATFIPPIYSDISPLTFGRNYVATLKPVNVNDAYNMLRGVILSDSFKNSFVKKTKKEEVTLKGHLSLIGIESVLESAGRFGIIVKAHDPKSARETAVKFAATLDDEAKNKILASVDRELQDYKIHYQKQLSLALAEAKKERKEQILKLKEALVIAKALNIKKPTMHQSSAPSSNELAYFRGTAALTEEIKSLENRASDEPFSPLIRKLNSEYGTFVGYKVNMDKVLVARMDGAIDSSDKPINRNKRALIILSFLVGFMLSCVLVVVLNHKSLLSTKNETGFKR